MVDKTLTVTAPTKRKDGAPFAPSELKQTRVFFKLTAATSFTELPALPPGQSTRVVQNLFGGDYIARAIWVDTKDVESDPLDVPFSIAIAPPGQGTLAVS